MNYNDSNTIREAISALADDELIANGDISEAELIELVCKDQDAMASWQCMHLTRDVLQADYHSALKPGFASSVSAKIALEDLGEMSAGNVVSMGAARQRVANRTSQRQSQGRAQVATMPAWKPLAGFGLAASLAGATFLFSQLLQTEKPEMSLVAQAEQNALESTELDANLVQQAGLKTSTYVAPALQASVNADGTRWRMGTDATQRNVQVEQRLNALLTNHLEDARMGRVQGLVSHSRVVGYDSVPSEE